MGVAILVFIVLPVLAVLVRSVGVGGDGFTLDNYSAFFDRYYLGAYWNSINALLSTLIVVAPGVFVSLYVTRGRSIGSKFVSGSRCPPVAPPFVFSLALILFGRRDWQRTGSTPPSI